MQIYRDYYQKHQKQLLSELYSYLKFPSIATDHRYYQETCDCAVWVEHMLSQMGCHVESWKVEGHPPVIYATRCIDKTKPTVLIYGHYDVQPVDPLDQWITPPFEPTLRDNKLFARGSSDNKGQNFYVLAALRACCELRQSICNVKLVIEGEEESGSAGLHALLSEKKEALKADYLLIVDSGFQSIESPEISLGVRGLVACTVTCKVADIDMHSGMVGGVVYNPNRVVSQLISALYDADGRVAIPGFYDEVVQMTPEEKSVFSFDFDMDKMKQEIGISAVSLEKGVTPGEAVTIRPTVEINGIAGGYAGEGLKTVIPAQAMFKVTSRLVPRQNPARIIALLKDFFVTHAPPGVQITIDIHPGGGAAVRSSPSNRLALLLKEAYGEILGKPCLFSLSGGTIPIGAALRDVVQAEPVFAGLALSGDHIHAPNEYFSLDRLEKGFLSICYCLEKLS